MCSRSVRDMRLAAFISYLATMAAGAFAWLLLNGIFGLPLAYLFPYIVGNVVGYWAAIRNEKALRKCDNPKPDFGE